MANRRAVLPDDLGQLLELIQGGKLFALQDWIKEGKRIRVSAEDECEPRALHAAVSTGFHSLVEELLRAGGWSVSELADALDLSRLRKRYDIADLLLKYGAQPKQLDFQTCCVELDLGMMERHLRNGTDPNCDNDFAIALSSIKARPLLGFYRQFRAEFPALDDQAALALSEAVKNEHVRWTALLAWAGADPFRPVPNDISEPFPVAPENCTTAAREAMWRKNPEILKALHLKPTAAQAVELLEHVVSYRPDVELLRAFLAPLKPELINDSTRHSSTALDRLVRYRPWDSTAINEGEQKVLQCLEILLDAGARWNPPPEEIRYIRRSLMEHDARHIVQVLRLLLYTPNAADIESLLELCRSQTLQGKIAAVDVPLTNELKALKKSARPVNVSDAEANRETVPVASESPHI
jgi:hypothetical protein